MKSWCAVLFFNSIIFIIWAWGIYQVSLNQKAQGQVKSRVIGVKVIVELHVTIFVTRVWLDSKSCDSSPHLWSKHIDTTVAKMGRSLSIIKCFSAFLTTLSTRQVLQAIVLSHLDYCSVVWSGATKRDLGKLQLAQNRAAWLALGCTQRANINNMHVNPS